MDEFDIPPVPEIKPVSLEGFTRYQIFPDGRVYDTERKKNVHFNRWGNFALFHDDKRTDEKTGKKAYIQENIRLLIRDFVKQGIPGFVKELPPFQPLIIYNPNKPVDEVLDAADELKKRLLDLRKAVKRSTEPLLAAMTAGRSFEKQKQDYANATSALEEFKKQYPDYYKWPVYKEQVETTPQIVKELKEEEQELMWEKVYLDEVCIELRSKLRGILGLVGINTIAHQAIKRVYDGQGY